MARRFALKTVGECQVSCKCFSLLGTRFSKEYGIKDYGFGPSIRRIFVFKWAIPLHGCGARDQL